MSDEYSDDEFEPTNNHRLNQSPYFANKDNSQSIENEMTNIK